MRPGSIAQKNRILDAAAEVFAARGFAGARVDEIASAAGVNKRLLYHYVGAKQELLEAVLERESANLDDAGLDSVRLWSLVLAEAGQSSANRLIHRVITIGLRREGHSPGEGLARKMFSALVPAGSVLLEELIDHSDQRRKPRVRMMPRVVTAQDSPRKRSKHSK